MAIRAHCRIIPQELDSKIQGAVNIYTIHYWQMMRHEFDHAGEVETSLLLAISPELVRMDRAMPNSKKLVKVKGAYNSIANAPRSISQDNWEWCLGRSKEGYCFKRRELDKRDHTQCDQDDNRVLLIYENHIAGDQYEKRSSKDSVAESL